MEMLKMKQKIKFWLAAVNMTHCLHWKEKWSNFLILKVESLAERKFDPGFIVIDSMLRVKLSIWLSISKNYNIESNWIDIESQIQYSISSQLDSNILQLLWIQGRISVPPVT